MRRERKRKEGRRGKKRTKEGEGREVRERETK